VLVSDVGMPGTDGFALVREIRNFQSEKTRKLPAIAVTAYANPEDRVRALVAGYQNHIPKPVDANVLAAAIAKLVVR
jgi:CheY-like chemotaxis protein